MPDTCCTDHVIPDNYYTDHQGGGGMLYLDISIVN